MPDILPTFDFADLSTNSLEDLRSMRLVLQKALTGPDVRIMMRTVGAVLAGRVNEIIQPARTLEGLLTSEYFKGYYFGMAQTYVAAQGKLDEIDAVISSMEPHDA